MKVKFEVVVKGSYDHALKQVTSWYRKALKTPRSVLNARKIVMSMMSQLIMRTL